MHHSGWADISPLFAAVKIIYRHCPSVLAGLQHENKPTREIERLLRPSILRIKAIFCHADSEYSFWLNANFYIVAGCMKII